MCRASLILLVLFIVRLTTAEPIPKSADRFLVNHCLDCHDADTEKGEVNLDFTEIDWSDPESAILWTKVHDVIKAGEMPPEKKPRPGAKESEAMLDWLDESLTRFDRPGGTVLRRLNRSEYENSVRSALGIPFHVTSGFPNDTKFHGFNNIGEGLVLSPPLLQQYYDLAGIAAYEILPPPRKKAKADPETTELAPDQFSMAFEAVQLRDDVMRLVSQFGIVVRSCTWPTRFEAPFTGTYRVKFKLSAFQPESDEPLAIELLDVPPTVTFSKIEGIPRLAEFTIPADGKVHEVEVEFDLEMGRTAAVYWANAPMGVLTEKQKRNGDGPHSDVRNEFLRDPKLYAAWKKIGYDRMRSPKETWSLLKETMKQGDLDLGDPDLKNPPERYPATTLNQLGWALQNMKMERGPALDVHGATFFGPTVIKDSRGRTITKASNGTIPRKSEWKERSRIRHGDPGPLPHESLSQTGQQISNRGIRRNRPGPPGGREQL